MSTWSDAPKIQGPPQTEDVSVLVDYVKKLANVTAKMAKDLEFILNGNVAFDNIQANGIKANNIQAGAITTEKLQAGAVTADKITVSELSAITADLGHITAGLIEAVQIFGSYIATSMGSYPRAEMSNTENMFRAASSPSNRIEMRALGYPNAVSDLHFINGSDEASMGLSPSAGLYSSGRRLTCEFTDIYLRGYSGVRVPSWSALRAEDTGENLQNALDGLAINMTFDPTTRNLKLWSRNGSLLAQVNIP
ncbi:hypothetical protein ACL02P_15300 [Paenibacillus sp. MB22_1]|uniref:hypothetical protein n=1 Tax=Paenibacillus sp. MB22_1 TaxID=3383121 RepID=UPI0039A0817F